MKLDIGRDHLRQQLQRIWDAGAEVYGTIVDSVIVTGEYDGTQAQAAQHATPDPDGNEPPSPRE